MKTIELKKGETARIIGGKIIIEEAFQPKDGDFVTLDDQWVSIYKSSKSNDYIYDYGGTGMPGSHYNRSWSVGGLRHVSTSIRPSTKAEIQIALDALDKNVLRWNASEKRVEKKRWRAKKGEEYWFVHYDLKSRCDIEALTTIDNARFDSGNYFKTEEESDAIAQEVRELYNQNLK